jgi:hypothetical protein
MSTNYEMKIEKRERYYRIIFTPDINYGNISVKVFTRKEAYAKYHEIKNADEENSSSAFSIRRWAWHLKFAGSVPHQRRKLSRHH